MKITIHSSVIATVVGSLLGVILFLGWNIEVGILGWLPGALWMMYHRFVNRGAHIEIIEGDY